MKRVIKFISLIVISMLLFGCSIEPQSIDVKKNCEVEFLFEQDGVKVYRFRDGGYRRYFTTRGDTFWQESSGKTTRPMEVLSVPLDQVKNEDSD